MEIMKLRTLVIENFKPLNNLNPDFGKAYLISVAIVLTESMIFLYKVEIHQNMVIEGSELLDHIHGTPCQKILSPLIL